MIPFPGQPGQQSGEVAVGRPSPQSLQPISVPNILIVGRSGVGKSSLINAIFGADLAVTGAGKPITQYYSRYANRYAVLYDSRGWTHGPQAEEEFFTGTRDFLRQFRTLNPVDHLHLVWYAIDAPGARFTDIDLRVIRDLFAPYPVLVVLTKCDVARETEMVALERAVADAHLPNVAGVVRTAAAPLTIAAFGLDALLARSRDLLPDLQRQALELVRQILAGVVASLGAKEQRGRRVIWHSARNAAFAGAIPIPFVDIPIALNINHTMVRSIGTVYQFDDATIAGLISDHHLREWMRGTVVGRSVAIELVKFIPGVGIIAGMTVNAASTALVTAAIGYTFQAICSELSRQRMSDPQAMASDAWVQQYLDTTYTRVWHSIRLQPPTQRRTFKT